MAAQQQQQVFEDKTPTFQSQALLEIVARETRKAQAKIDEMKDATDDNVNISDMFAMQMQMNRLSQLSEMSTSVVSAANNAIKAMAQHLGR